MDNQKKATTDYSEYNKVYHPRAEHMVCFIKNLNHAMQKVEIPGAYEKIMHQLKCIGYSDELIDTICAAASCYKNYHKDRIQDEQSAVDRVKSGDMLYTVVQEWKLPTDVNATVSVLSVAKTPDKAKADMKELAARAKGSFKKAIKDAAPPDPMLCFDASMSEDRYEIHLDGSENDAYCRQWIGKSVFL